MTCTPLHSNVAVIAKLKVSQLFWEGLFRADSLRL